MQANKLFLVRNVVQPDTDVSDMTIHAFALAVRGGMNVEDYTVYTTKEEAEEALRWLKTLEKVKAKLMEHLTHMDRGQLEMIALAPAELVRKLWELAGEGR